MSNPYPAASLRPVPRDTRPFMQTRSGKPFPLIRPTPQDVNWHDVAFALAHANRYAGNAGVYNVAQHSVLVANVLPPDLRPHGLLHDAHEFAIGDMTKPTKTALEFLGLDMTAFEELRGHIDAALHAAAGLHWPLSDEDRKTIKHADLRVTMTEKRDVVSPMTVTDSEWLGATFGTNYAVVAPLPMTIVPWGPAEALVRFEMELDRYGII